MHGGAAALYHSTGLPRAPMNASFNLGSADFYGMNFDFTKRHTAVLGFKLLELGLLAGDLGG